MAAYSASSKRTSTDRRRRAARWVRLRALCGGGVAAGAAVAGGAAAGVVVAGGAASGAASTAPGRRAPFPRPAGGWPAPGPAAGTVGMASVSRPARGGSSGCLAFTYLDPRLELLIDWSRLE